MENGAILSASSEFNHFIFSYPSLFEHISATIPTLTGCIIIEQTIDTKKEWCVVVRFAGKNLLGPNETPAFKIISRGSVEVCLEFCFNKYRNILQAKKHSIYTYNWDRSPVHINTASMPSPKLSPLRQIGKIFSSPNVGAMSFSDGGDHYSQSGTMPDLINAAMIKWIQHKANSTHHLYINSPDMKPYNTTEITMLLGRVGLDWHICLARGVHIYGRFNPRMHKVLIVEISELEDVIVGVPAAFEVLKQQWDGWMIVVDNLGAAVCLTTQLDELCMTTITPQISYDNILNRFHSLDI